MQYPVITIDGPSGAGKGTLCLWLARQLGFHLLDSGALYRLSALAAKTLGVDDNDEDKVAEISKHLDVDFLPTDNGVAVMLSGSDVCALLRTEEVGMAASKVAAYPKVRQALVERQRNFASAPGLIADGRDMGTTIFPDADAKIFLTAGPETRAERRYQQLQSAGTAADYEQILADIRARDENDSNRAVSPLAPASDALVLDSSHLTIEEVCQQAMAYIESKGVK
ncbi:(d)CMP kinase [Halioxenophilus sp. WMMB6]|uniref:(d)CMP kinase n=1 Tax=Halioxenophilus sp. WMMB6 TaxID=3073815 RepID=UPI00295E867E|nr:(d)CMP kinase [Halioxenophilus sp. WMMB6]